MWAPTAAAVRTTVHPGGKGLAAGRRPQPALQRWQPARYAAALKADRLVLLQCCRRLQPPSYLPASAKSDGETLMLHVMYVCCRTEARPALRIAAGD